MSNLGGETSATIMPAGPEAAPVHLFRGIELWDGGDKAGALGEFEVVLALQPKNDLARSYRALCLLAQGDHKEAAAIWRKHGFSDNAMFQVRLVEFVEGEWLISRRFMGEATDVDLLNGVSAPRRAIKRFYRRDFMGMMRHLAEPPVLDEVEAFLGATACEMLRKHERAREYLEALRPRRAEWPDALVALDGRLKVREGKIEDAGRDFASIVVMGPEDFGMNYYLGVICLAYGLGEEARQYFLRAFTQYMVDTLEFQWWQVEQVLLNGGVGNVESGA